MEAYKEKCIIKINVFAMFRVVRAGDTDFDGSINSR